MHASLGGTTRGGVPTYEQSPPAGQGLQEGTPRPSTTVYWSTRHTTCVQYRVVEGPIVAFRRVRTCRVCLR